MAHRQFEEWLLADRPLIPAEADELRKHLETCESCSRIREGWTGVSIQLGRLKTLAPSAGFVDRWQRRLAAQRASRARTQSWWVLAGASFTALLLSSLLIGNWVGSFDSPAQFILTTVEDFTVAFSLLNVGAELLLTLAGFFPVLLVISLWAALSTLVLMGALWIVSLRQFAFQRRIHP